MVLTSRNNEEDIRNPAEICIDEGDYDKAKQLLLRFIASEPPSRQPLNDLELANTHWLLKTASDIVNQYPENAPAALFLGRLLYTHGSSAVARKILTKGLSLPSVDVMSLIMLRTYRFHCLIRERIADAFVGDLVDVAALRRTGEELWIGLLAKFVRAISETHIVDCAVMFSDAASHPVVAADLPVVASLLRAKAEELGYCAAAINECSLAINELPNKAVDGSGPNGGSLPHSS